MRNAGMRECANAGMLYCVIALLGAAGTATAGTNTVLKAEKEKRVKHEENRITVESRDKGSTGPWKKEKEFVLMFRNNRKGRK